MLSDLGSAPDQVSADLRAPTSPVKAQAELCRTVVRIAHGPGEGKDTVQCLNNTTERCE